MTKLRIRLDRSTGRLLPVLLIALVYSVFWILFSIVGPSEQFLPHPENIAMLLLCLILAFNLENRYARHVFFFWCAWFVLGAISLFAMNQLTWGLNYDVDSRAANRFYLVCVGVAILGALATQALSGRSLHAVTRPWRGRNLFIYLFLLVFPFLYGASVVLATGTIPIFSGVDISALMYEVDYGPLHGFGIFVPIAAVLIWLEVDGRGGLASSRVRQLTLFGFLACFLVLGSIDGRRAFTLIALMAIILVYLEKDLGAKRIMGAILMATFALVSYVVAAALRSGASGSGRYGTIYASLATVGVEYRDYVWGFVNLRPEVVRAAGYDWVESSMASATPGFVMSLLDIDKQEWVVRDSARTLMDFWNVELGIRVGLPGELWFEMQWLALPIMFLVGAVVQLLSRRVAQSSHLVYKAILATGLAVCAFSIMGQSTVTFGLILPLVYLALLTWFVERLFRVNIARTDGLKTGGGSQAPTTNAYR